MSVTDLEAVAALPTQLPSNFADVYCLVNNAGLALGVSSVDQVTTPNYQNTHSPHHLHMLSFLSDWFSQNNVIDSKTMLDSNVLGTIAFCSAFVPGMKQRGAGHIVNMGSCAGQYAYANGSVSYHHNHHNHHSSSFTLLSVIHPPPYTYFTTSSPHLHISVTNLPYFTLGL